MSFTADDKSVDFLFSKNCYRMPKNQRKYVWKTRNLQELYDDIMVVMNGFEKSHFIGSIVLCQDSDKENGISYYTIVDGQQRITTLSIFIASIVFWLKVYNAESEFNGLKQYLIATDLSNNEHLIVTTDSNYAFESIVKAIIITPSDFLKNQAIRPFLKVNSLNASNDNVVDAFYFFLTNIENTLKDISEDPVEYLKRLRDVLLNKILYVHIIATKEEDAYTIFEILNARGSALEDHELLKNYIMRGVKDESEIEIVKSRWNTIENNLGKSIHRFFSHYTIHKYKGNSNEYNGYTDYKIMQKIYKGKETSELLADILSKSNLYSKIISPCIKGDDKNCTPEEYNLFSFLKSRRQEQFRPLLLSILHKYSTSEICDENYKMILIFLYDFFVCFNIIGEETSNKISNIINSKAKELEDDYSDELLSELIEKLCNKLPKLDSFVNSFKLIGWSHHDNYYADDKFKKKVKIILEIFEKSKNANGECTEFTIEHIIDDSLGEDSAKIGNLLPLEDTLNNQCEGKSFEEKMEIYKKSNFYITREFVDRYSNKPFTVKEIESRSEYMAKELYNSILKFKEKDAISKKIKINKKDKIYQNEIIENTYEQLSFF